MLARFDPFRELDRLVDGVVGRSPGIAPIDAYRQGDNFHVAVDLPGVNPDEIDITVDRDVLVIRAERPRSIPEDAKLVVNELSGGTLSRRLLLGEGVDSEHISATYDAGVLHLTLPLAAKAAPRKVSVTSSTAVSAPGAEASADQGERVAVVA